MWGVCKLGSGVNVGNVNLGQHPYHRESNGRCWRWELWVRTEQSWISLLEKLSSIPNTHMRPSNTSGGEKLKRKGKCHFLLLLQELLWQWPLLCNARRRLKLWNCNGISVHYKPDSWDGGCGHPCLDQWHERHLENSGGGLQEQQVNVIFLKQYFYLFFSPGLALQ